MSGDTKFGKKSLGACSHFLTVSFEGDTAHLKLVKDKAYVSKIAKQMKVSVRFKSSSQKLGGKKTGKYKYWSAVGLIIDKLDEEMRPIEGQILTEGILDKLKNIYQKVKNFAISLFTKIKEYISQGFLYLLDFLDIEPEIEGDFIVKTAI